MQWIAFKISFSAPERHKFIHLLCVEFSNNSEDDDTQGNNYNVVASSNERREQDGVGGWSEHISMYLFPAILISQVSFLQTITV